MKMIFHGGKKRLFGIWSMFKKVLERDYSKELKDGTIKFGWDFDKEMWIETNDPKLMSQMKKDFGGLKGRFKRAQLRVVGIKVEVVE